MTDADFMLPSQIARDSREAALPLEVRTYRARMASQTAAETPAYVVLTTPGDAPEPLSRVIVTTLVDAPRPGPLAAGIAA